MNFQLALSNFICTLSIVLSVSSFFDLTLNLYNLLHAANYIIFREAFYTRQLIGKYLSLQVQQYTFPFQKVHAKLLHLITILIYVFPIIYSINSIFLQKSNSIYTFMLVFFCTSYISGNNMSKHVGKLQRKREHSYSEFQKVFSYFAGRFIFK